MTRIAVFSILGCVIAGLLFYLWKSDSEVQMLPEQNNQVASIVFAARDVKEGAVIPEGSLEDREIPANEIPPGAMQGSSNSLGRRARFGLKAGQVVTQNDLVPAHPGTRGVAVVSVNDIPKGAVIQARDLEKREVRSFPPDGVLRPELVVGKKTKSAISKGHVLTGQDVDR